MTIDPRHARLMTPGGTRDFLPEDAARKSALEGELQETFRRWGYGQVITPTVEHLETLLQSNGQETGDKLYRLFDREGHTLALRPELTTPIARIAATRLKDEPRPVRLHYVANVFRHESLKAGRQREFWQAGVELLGATGAAADAEVIALAVEALRKSGLRSFRVEIGHVAYFNGLLNGLSLPTASRRALRRALLRRDYVGFEAALAVAGGHRARSTGGEEKRATEGQSVSEGQWATEGRSATEAQRADDEGRAAWERLRQLPRLRGGADVIERALRQADNAESRAAAEDVAAIWDELASHGVLDFVQVDFGMIKDLDYYTGMVLEGYTDGIGFPVCTGGRYDNLVGRFGPETPATGFVLGVERVLDALAIQGAGAGAGERDVRPDVLLMYEAAGRDRALAGARTLRERGVVVELDVTARPLAESRDYAKARGISELIFVADARSVLRLRAPSYEAEEAMVWP